MAAEIRVVDTSAWIEWLTGSPLGKKLGKCQQFQPGTALHCQGQMMALRVKKQTSDHLGWWFSSCQSCGAFGDWLLDQHARTDAVGDLARRAAQDPRFPRSKWRLSVFLTWAGEDTTLRSIVKQAHAEWRTT